MSKSKIVVLSFTDAAQELGGIEIQQFQKLKGYDLVDYISFSDEHTTWFNHVDIDKVKSLVEGYETVICIGNSMGAFSSIMFSNFHKVDKVIAFAPQYSVHPDTPPYEKRWNHRLSHIKEWKFKHLEFNDTTQYFIISGNNPKEMKHIDLIEDKPNIHKKIIDGYGHDVSYHLKRKKQLYTLIYNIIENGKFN